MTIDDLLDRAPAEAVRRRALALMDAIDKARVRLETTTTDDPEALHDFRVGLRRLRSLLRAHRGELGRKLDRHRQRLGEVAEATGQARDAEVQLGWLERLDQKDDALGAKLRAAQHAGMQAIRERALPHHDALAPKLRRRLERCRLDLEDGADDVAYGTQLADLLCAHGADLVAALAAIHTADEEAAAHAARIAGKRLRYLVEPLAGSAALGEDAAELVERLKALQDALGELHDLHVLGHVVADSPMAAPIRAQRDRLFVEVTRQRDTATAWLPGVAALAERLAPTEVEIERKYLLRALPELPAGPIRVIEMEQGYLPGERLHERLRVSRSADGVRRVRTMKLGAGVRRIEVEEDCPAELFDRMWPLTAGKRVKKRRHCVKVGELIWEIDEFLDRELFVAEIELPSAEIEVTLPPWLAAVVVRDATGDKTLTNLALAR